MSDEITENQENFNVNKAFAEIRAYKAEAESSDQDVLNNLLSARSDKDKTISVPVNGIIFKVFRNIPRDIEQKIHDYKLLAVEQGEFYVPDTLDEEKAPLFLILSGLCVEKPYNKVSFWESYDKQSNGDVKNILDELMAGIADWREKTKKFRRK